MLPTGVIRLFTLLTIKDQHHTVQVALVQVENSNLYVSVTERVTPPAYVAACTITTCASGEYLHQLIEGKYHKSKVQRSGHMVQ